MGNEETYLDAIDLWGADAQLLMLAEEAAELAVAVHHFRRDQSGWAIDALADEVADVQIMIEQLVCMMPAIEGDIATAKRRKLNRLKCRITAVRNGGEG